MSISNKSRREFLKKGLTTVVGVGCLRYGLREAIAQSVVSGKPVLTHASLNALIPKTPATLHPELTKAHADIKAYVRNHFTLTPAQQKALTGMTAAQVNQINNSLNTALQKNYRLKVNIVSPRDPQTGQATGKRNQAVQKVREAADEKEPGIQLGPATITADASYNAHDGFSGTVSFSFSC